MMIGLSNIVFGIYLCGVKPWKKRIDNRLEFANELVISFATFCLVIYTDFVHDLEAKSTASWLPIGVISLFILFYFILIVYDAVSRLILCGRYGIAYCEKKFASKDEKVKISQAAANEESPSKKHEEEE